MSFELQTPIHEQKFLDNLKSRGIPFKLIRLRNERGLSYQIGEPSLKIYCKKPFSQPFIKRLITNPSSFTKCADYLKYITALLPNVVLEETRIFRLDLAVDYETSFKTIYRNLDYKYKRVKIEFLGKSEKWTGVNIGSGNEKIITYDHQKKHRGSKIKTRIECQMKGSKVPISSVMDISTLPEKLKVKNPFCNLKLKSVQICPLSDYPSERDQKKINELKLLIEHNGFLSARKKLNPHRNFKRDYEKYLRFKDSFEQPADIIIKSLKKYTERT